VNHLSTQIHVHTELKRQHIQIQAIKVGSYFASRVLVDEAMVKNYIKTKQ